MAPSPQTRPMLYVPLIAWTASLSGAICTCVCGLCSVPLGWTLLHLPDSESEWLIFWCQRACTFSMCVCMGVGVCQPIKGGSLWNHLLYPSACVPSSVLALTECLFVCFLSACVCLRCTQCFRHAFHSPDEPQMANNWENAFQEASSLLLKWYTCSLCHDLSL